MTAATLTGNSPTFAEPLLGLRTWAVIGARGEERLRGPYSGAPWPDRGAWLQASCTRDGAHPVPAPECSCGVYGLHPTRRNAWRALAFRREIGGVVEARGAVELHADGFRAQEGRPHLLLAHPRSNPYLLRRLSEAYEVPVVEVRGPKALLAWCRAHDIGLAPTVLQELLAP